MLKPWLMFELTSIFHSNRLLSELYDVRCCILFVPMSRIFSQTIYVMGQNSMNTIALSVERMPDDDIGTFGRWLGVRRMWLRGRFMLDQYFT